MFNKTKEELIAFEQRIADLFDEGEIPYLIHLSGGNEDQLIEIFKDINPGDYVLSTHRSHYHYLLKNGSEEDLEEKIRDGQSMFVFDKSLNFMTSSILAGMAPIAAGIAMGLQMKKSKNHVWCFLGDGSMDNGHALEAIQMVQGRNLNCTFVIEDNNRSVETEKKDRYNYELSLPSCVKRYKYKCTQNHGGSNSGKWVTFKDLPKK